ncbi:MAG: glycosyltransferase, partial [Candidatus Uhrbacteria bacterium]
MRIAIDCRTILNPGHGEDAGVGHYTSAIVKEVLRQDPENEYVLFFGARLGSSAIDELVANHPKVKVRQFPFYDYRKALPLIHSHFLIARAIAKQRPDLLFVPTHEVPMFYQGRTVIFVHDLAILRNPDWFVQVKAERSVSAGLLLPRGIKKAAKILVPSKATKKDLIEYFPDSRKKIVVVPHGVTRHEVTDHPLTKEMKQRFAINGKYILSLCTLEPRKNIA